MTTQQTSPPKNNSAIDLSALQKVDFFSRNANYLSNDWLSVVLIYGIFIIFMAVLGKWGVMIIFLSLIAGVVFYSKAKDAHRKHQVIYREFANANSFLYTDENKNIHESGTLYAGGYNHIERDILEGSFCELPMRLSEYHYETGSGKSHTNYDIRVLRLELPRRLPHMVIDCLVEPGESGDSTLPIVFDKSQRFELEGDFYKYFTLYAPDTYAVSALTVIAPDTMDALLRMEALCDIEIIDNYIYFYWPDNTQGAESYKKVFETVEDVMKEIKQKLTKDDIFATISQARVHAETAQGVKLKQSRFTTGIIVTILIFAVTLIAPSLLNIGLTYELVALQWVLMGGVVLWGVYKSIKKSRLRKQLNQRYHTNHKN